MAGIALDFNPATSPFFDMLKYCVAALLIAVFVAESSSGPDEQVCAARICEPASRAITRIPAGKQRRRTDEGIEEFRIMASLTVITALSVLFIVRCCWSC
jgi:hypothetical protein